LAARLPRSERFAPWDALAAPAASIAEKGQQIVTYCGYRSNNIEWLRITEMARRSAAAAKT